MNSAQKLVASQMAEIMQLCSELPLIEDRLRRAGLHQTASELNKAVKRIGFEAAEKREFAYSAASPATSKDGETT